MAWFGSGQNAGAPTPESISRQRAIANALLQQSMDASPVQHWTQGLARVLAGGLGGYKGSQADADAAEIKRKEELEAATERAKAEAEKRNTPEWKFGPDGSLYNWNPYMAEGGKPLLLSQAQQKADEWKSAGDGRLYRTGADGMPEFQQFPTVGGGKSGNPYDEEYAKTSAREDAKKNSELGRKITSAGLDAQSQMNSLDRTEQLASDPDVYQGTGAQFTLPIRRAMSVIPGLNQLPYSSPEAVAKSDEFASLSNAMALMVRNPDAGLGMPGALSDKDREFLQSTVPGLSRSPGGNKLMIEAAKRVQRRKIEIADFKSQYVQENGKIDDKFFEIVSKWAQENPMFEDLTTQGGAPEAQAGQANKPKFVVPITSDAEFDALPPGAFFKGPDGKTRQKP